MKSLIGVISCKDPSSEAFFGRLEYYRAPVDLSRLPFNDAVEALAGFYNTTIRVDVEPSEAPPQPVVSESARSINLPEAIQGLLRSGRLDFVVRVHGAIVIASPTAAHQHWPGYEALHEMFPSLKRLEVDW